MVSIATFLPVDLLNISLVFLILWSQMLKPLKQIRDHKPMRQNSVLSSFKEEQCSQIYDLLSNLGLIG